MRGHLSLTATLPLSITCEDFSTGASVGSLCARTSKFLMRPFRVNPAAYQDNCGLKFIRKKKNIKCQIILI